MRRFAYHAAVVLGGGFVTCVVMAGLLIAQIDKYSKDMNEVSACGFWIMIFSFGAFVCLAESIGAFLYWRGWFAAPVSI